MRVPDAPRLLHRDSTYPHPTLGTGYTDRPDQAVFDEPEAISVQEQELLTARVRRQERQAQLAEWEQRRAAIEREIDWLHSQRFRHDVTRALRGLRRQLAWIDRAVGG